MRTRSLALALAAAVLAAVPAAAQEAIVRGQVVDGNNRQPVAYAAVYVDNDRTVTVADAQGRFQVRHLRPGTRAIWADAPGYSMDLSAVEVVRGVAEVTLEMRSDPVQLATLRVSTNRLDRRSRAYGGVTRVFRQADLAAMWYSNLLEMVQFRAGVRLSGCVPGYASGGYAAGRNALTGFYGSGSDDDNCVYTRGKAEGANLFVDDTKWIGGLPSLADFQLAEVARVEVFDRGREVRVYTRQFMDWASKRAYIPTPVGLGF
jgi:hypothetical protein